MEIKYGCPYWGNESISPSQFLKKITASGFQGIELYLDPESQLSKDWICAIEETRTDNPDFFFSLLQLNITPNESVEEHIRYMQKNIPLLAALQPNFINCHTGRDFFSFDDNCRLIETAEDISKKHNVRILHETHRSRFSFHAPGLLPYLKKFPDMQLLGDLSHFTVVSESMLEHISETLEAIFPHISHIHARIGHEQAPQVNDPSAPEWKSHLDIFMSWWKRILEIKKQLGQQLFTITPEFGPPPYLPCSPFSQEPLSDAYKNNSYILNALKTSFGESI